MAEITFNQECTLSDEDGIFEIYVQIEFTIDTAATIRCAELMDVKVTCEAIPTINTKAIAAHLEREWRVDERFRRRLCYRAEEELRKKEDAEGAERFERRFPEVAAQLRRQQMEALARRGVA